MSLREKNQPAQLPDQFKIKAIDDLMAWMDDDPQSLYDFIYYMNKSYRLWQDTMGEHIQKEDFELISDGLFYLTKDLIEIKKVEDELQTSKALN